MNQKEYQNKKFGVYGLGKTGIASIQFLRTMEAQEINAWDDNIENFDLTKDIFTGANLNYCQALWSQLDFIIMSPGIPMQYPKYHAVYTLALTHNITILSDIDLLVEERKDSFFISVTGTNGKSTTVSLINHIFTQCQKPSIIAGNFGKAALSEDVVFNKNMNYILELSSFQLDLLLKKTFFDVSVILNVTPDHADRYSSFESYCNAKKKLLKHTKKLLVINIDDTYNYKLFAQLQKEKHKVVFKIIPISEKNILKNGISILNQCLYYNGIRDAEQIKYPLDTQLSNHNILASYTTCNYIGLTEFFKHLMSFRSLPHRAEIIYRNASLTVVNDSKATNTASTARALQNFQNIHWIAGGILKEKDLSPLTQYLTNVKHCYFFGQDKEKFVDLAHKNSLPHIVCKDLKDALFKIYSSVSIGTVLLSPACASFDQWQNYKARGNAFKKITCSWFGSLITPLKTHDI